MEKVINIFPPHTQAKTRRRNLRSEVLRAFLLLVSVAIALSTTFYCFGEEIALLFYQMFPITDPHSEIIEKLDRIMSAPVICDNNKLLCEGHTLLETASADTCLGVLAKIRDVGVGTTL